MTKDDLTKFGTTLAALAELFGAKPSTELFDMYWQVLSPRMTFEQFRTATSNAAATLKFMPKPAELLEAVGIGGSKAMEARIAEAWDAVRGAMDKHDYTTSVDFGPLVNAVVRSCGGWTDLCAKSIPDLVWSRKEFAKLYEAFAEKDAATLKGEPLRGAFAGPVVRVPIGGVTPPLALPAQRSEVADVVRNLADGKSV